MEFITAHNEVQLMEKQKNFSLILAVFQDLVVVEPDQAVDTLFVVVFVEEVKR